ncbi:MAG TPA: PilN domain-containing protein [Bryobacteraceae bacterium]|nr:PilN domain-containing protein [Bryobacteraceae bacterium]
MTAVSNLRKWLAFGTGVGIEIGREDLKVTVARVRPGGVRIIGYCTVPKFREHPAGDWGSRYASFLEKLGVSHLTATVLLPREDVIVRQVPMPGVADRDIAAALNYQVDAMHPYAEEEAQHAWARIGKTPQVMVGITRRSVLEKYLSLLREAGIKVSSFTFSAAVMHSALRLYGLAASDGFIATDRTEDGEGFEVYGESTSHPLFSARLDMPEERAVALALSELRLPPELESSPFESILPKPVAAPVDDSSRAALPYATSLVGACPWLALPVNLLPETERAVRSRWMYVPTIALASILLLALGAVAAFGAYGNRRYIDTMEREIKQVEPRARRAAELDREIAIARNRAQTLDNFRLRSKEDMDALNELSRVLGPPTWLGNLQLSRTSLQIGGETDQAASLLKVLDGTKQFKHSEFTMPMTRTIGGESFSIKAAREGVTP